MNVRSRFPQKAQVMFEFPISFMSLFTRVFDRDVRINNLINSLFKGKTKLFAFGILPGDCRSCISFVRDNVADSLKGSSQSFVFTSHLDKWIPNEVYKNTRFHQFTKHNTAIRVFRQLIFFRQMLADHTRN